MKVTKILIAMLASAFIVTACDPIEDEDLRDKYVTDAGTPITKEALQAAISITQPFPNQDGVVEGCLLYTSPSPRDMRRSRMPSSA